MAKLEFTDKEIECMKSAHMIGHTSWDDASLKGIKTKIKDLNLSWQKDSCCYCMRPLNGEFLMVIDIEHILPKSLFVKHMFTVKNLSVSCKRCNLNIKKSKVDFLSLNINQLPKRLFRSQFYKFVHPNLDNIESHLVLQITIVGRKHKLIKYQVINDSAKGAFNYSYFELEKLEVDSFNTAQNVKPKVEILDENIRDEFRLLNEKFNQ